MANEGSDNNPGAQEKASMTDKARQMWDRGRQRWNTVVVAGGSSFIGALKSREFWGSAALTFAGRTALRATVIGFMGATPLAAITTGAVFGGMTGTWKEASQIRREQAAAASNKPLTEVRLKGSERFTSVFKSDVWKGNGSRLAMAAGKGALVGAAGGLLGFGAGAIAEGALENVGGALRGVGESIDQAWKGVTGSIPFRINPEGVSAPSVNIPSRLNGVRAGISLDQGPSLPSIYSTINFEGIDSTYQNIPGVGGEWSSLTGWEQAQIGNLALQNERIFEAFDANNPTHLKILDEYIKDNRDLYQKQLDALGRFVRQSNSNSIFHPIHQDLLRHNVRIVVPQNPVMFLRAVA